MTTTTFPGPRSITIRPDPKGSGATVGVLGFLFALVGSAVFAGVLGTAEGFERYGMGLLATVLGAGMIVYAFRSATTTARLAIEGPDLVVAWARLGRTVGSQRVPLRDVMDVAVGHVTGQRHAFFNVVIGTRRGDMPLSTGKSNDIAFYTRVRDDVARFLGVPIRTH